MRSAASGAATLALSLLLIPGTEAAQTTPGGPRRVRAFPSDVVSLLLDGRPGGDLEVRIASEVTPPITARTGSIDLTIAVPSAPPADGLSTAPALEIYVYALGPGHQVRAHLGERHEIAAGADVQTRLSGLSTGDRIRVLVRQEGSSRFSLHEISMTAAASAAEGDGGRLAGASGWTGGGGRGGGSADAARAGQKTRRQRSSPAELERRAGKAKVLARSYEEVLRSYSSGSSDRGVEELRRFELGTLEAAGKDHVEMMATLGDAESAVAERLGKREPDSLVPVLLLHLAAHDRYVVERELRLAAHSRDRVSEIAELYAEAGKSETAIRLASDALTAVGSYLQGANQITAGRRALERAIELDPENLEARLCIALGHESHGDYVEALDQLDKLESFGSYDDEVRLRRATILRRIGRFDDAMAIFESLIAGSRESWIVMLAYQELARIYIAREQTQAAVASLERATRRFPRDATLLLNLAYALERQGASDRALSILDSVDRAPGRAPAPPTARTRYQSGLDLVGGRSELLDRSALALLPVLASTLESIFGAALAGGA